MVSGVAERQDVGVVEREIWEVATNGMASAPMTALRSFDAAEAAVDDGHFDNGIDDEELAVADKFVAVAAVAVVADDDGAERAAHDVEIVGLVGRSWMHHLSIDPFGFGRFERFGRFEVL